MVLDGLIPIYQEIKKRSETYCVFKFNKNKIEFDIFFDIGTNPFRLGFLLIESNFELWLDVQQGFRISTMLEREKLKELRELLGLKFDPNNPFSTKSFFEEFNSKIPNTPPHYKKEQRDRIVLYSFSIEEPDKLYYAGIIEWDKMQSGRKRSFENLEKTRLLFPELYRQIRDRNVSVRYSSTKTDAK